MADFNVVMPKLGESVQEATIIKWLVKPGDVVEEDDVLLEIATDKVDSEIPSPVAGKVLKLLFEENALVPVGETIAIINTEGEGDVQENSGSEKKKSEPAASDELKTSPDQPADGTNINKEENNKSGDKPPKQTKDSSNQKNAGRFYSPLIMSIASKENISSSELDNIKGTGENGRVRKDDVLKYVENLRKQPPTDQNAEKTGKAEVKEDQPKVNISIQPGDEIVQMDRMRRIIADHMVMSKRVSPHVSNFVEADVTNLVLWREKFKDAFLKREKIKLTFMPAFIEATSIALKEFRGVNASVDGDNIVLRKNINIGIAVALPSGNLIVPVLKNADQKSLVGLAIELNRLSEQARNGKLSPDDIQGGTFTISNFGTFRNITGTPIINQPQVAILATGNIEKKPAVIETPTGDVIAIRHKMILSVSYDHRVVDGALAGMFLRRIADILEGFDSNRQI